MILKEIPGLFQISVHSFSSPETKLNFSLNCKSNHVNMKNSRRRWHGGRIDMRVLKEEGGRLQKKTIDYSHPHMHTHCKVTLQLFPSKSKICFSISWSWSWTHDLLWPMDLVRVTEAEFSSIRTWRSPVWPAGEERLGRIQVPWPAACASMWVKPPV